MTNFPLIYRRDLGIFSLILVLTAIAPGQTLTPTITSLSPNFVFAGQSSIPPYPPQPPPQAEFFLQVNGSGFSSGSTIIWNGTGLTTYFIDTTILRAVLTADRLAIAGTATVTVNNLGGFVSNASTFTILPPSIAPANSLRIPHIADGTGWTTTLVIENLDVAPVNYTLNIWGDDGRALPLPMLNADGTPAALTGTLPAGATYYLQSPGISLSLTEGWAEAFGNGKLGLMAFFKYTAPGVPDSQGTVIGKTSANTISMPYDNTNGFITGIALANSNPNQGFAVKITIIPDLGTIGGGGVSVAPHGHTAFVLNFPQAVGTRGIVQFSAPSADLTVLGERFAPNFSFTTLGTFQ